ncbi:MAG: carbonic anhydrase, partial [Rhodospirillales bacterium]
QQDNNKDRNRAVQTEQAVVRLSLQNLETFPWVTERIANGSLELHGFYFDISNGFVQWLNPTEDKFEDFD